MHSKIDDPKSGWTYLGKVTNNGRLYWPIFVIGFSFSISIMFGMMIILYNISLFGGVFLFENNSLALGTEIIMTTIAIPSDIYLVLHHVRQPN